MVDLLPVLADLLAESAELDAVVSALPEEGWATPTPAGGWTIAHQVAHLAWSDEAARLAIGDPAAFRAELQRSLGATGDLVDDAAAARAAQAPAALLAQWRVGRAAVADALRGVAPGTKLDWFGPPMSATSMATARLMETWAHGQDIVDALGIVRSPTARLRHVAHLGVRARAVGYLVRDRKPPSAAMRVELIAPDGVVWSWGAPDASESVTGPALDFCLLVTRRRHRADLALVVGADADAWLDIAQAFAGPPGTGRTPTAR